MRFSFKLYENIEVNIIPAIANDEYPEYTSIVIY